MSIMPIMVNIRAELRYRNSMRAWIWILMLGCAVVVLSAAGCASAQALQQPPIWTIERTPPAGITLRPKVTGPYAIVRFNKPAFDALMAKAGREGDAAATGVIIELPMPDGSFERFLAKESSILAPELAAAYPEMRTWSGQGLDDKAATTRFGWTAAGFHAIILTGSRGSVYIDTWAPSTLDVYLAYRKSP